MLLKSAVGISCVKPLLWKSVREKDAGYHSLETCLASSVGLEGGDKYVIVKVPVNVEKFLSVTAGVRFLHPRGTMNMQELPNWSHMGWLDAFVPITLERDQCAPTTQECHP
jgi:hypothetical protein